MFNLLTLVLAEPPAKDPQITPVQSASASTLSATIATPLPTPVAVPEMEVPEVSSQSGLGASDQRLLAGSLRVDQTQSLPIWQISPDSGVDRQVDDNAQLATSVDAPSRQPKLPAPATVTPPKIGLEALAVPLAPPPAHPKTPTATAPASLPDVSQRIGNTAVPLPSPSTSRASVTVEPVLSVPEQAFIQRKRDRQKVIEARLAEIIARDRIAKDPRFQETQMTTAIDYANQGEFDQARKIIQTIAISPQVQAKLLAKVNILEKANTKRTLVPAQLPLPRQTAMRKAMSYPLPDNQFTSSIRSPEPYSSEGAPRFSRRFDLGVVNPDTANSLAYYQPAPPTVFNNDDQQIVYPLPVPAPITSPFGWRRHPISGTRRFHSGTDIGANQGTPVMAAYSGRIKGADYMGGYGLAIVVEHQNGSLKTLYAHLSQVKVRPGDWVKQGMIIGAVGSTGASTGPHLHFEMRKLASDGWATLDPGPQLAQARNQLVRLSQRTQRDQSLRRG